MCPWSGFLTPSFHIIYPRAMSLSMVFMLVFITVAVSVHLGDSCLWLFHLSVLMSLSCLMSCHLLEFTITGPQCIHMRSQLTQHIKYFAEGFISFL